MSADKSDIQKALRAIFEKYDLSVGVGLTREGVAIRSQDARVDACNVGNVIALNRERQS